MATLKTVNFSGDYGSHFQLRLDYSYSQNTSTNKTTITYTEYFISKDGYSAGGSSSNGYINGSVVGSTTGIGANQTQKIGTKTVEITHNNDGTFPNTSYSASLSTPWNHVGSASLSGTLTSSNIPKINRASTWNVGLVELSDIGDEFELQINQYVSDYHNVVTITDLQKTTTVKTINNAVNGTTVQFDASELSALYTLDTNTTINPIKFYLNLTTYDSNNNQIGTEQRITGYGTLTNAEPTVTYTKKELNSKVVTIMGSSSASNIVQTVSIVKFTITATPQYSATISSVTVDGQQATYNSDTQKYEVELTNLNANYYSGLTPYHIFTIIVTDSRGITKNRTPAIRLYYYKIVTINTWTIERASQTSSDLILNANITCYDGTIYSTTNTRTVQYSTDNSNWTTISSSDYTFASDTITITNLTLSNVLSYQTSGTFYLKVYDKLTTAQDNKDVAVGIYTFAKGDRKVRINGTLEIADSDGNNRVNVMNYINDKSLEKYSSTEILIGKWKDNKDLYSRTIDFTTSSGNSYVIFTDNTIDTLVDVDGWIAYSSGYHKLGGYANSSFYSLYQWNTSEKKLYIYYNGYGNKDGFITIKYTKV